MNDLVDKARSRRVELLAELAELDNFLRTAAKLGEAEAPENTDVVYQRPPLQESSNLAATILQVSGRLHISEIIKNMIERGWRSSGDPRLDYKNIHNNLSGKPERFKKLGHGFFSLGDAPRMTKTNHLNDRKRRVHPRH